MLDALAGVEVVDDDLDLGTRRGDLALELVERDDALALAAEVDEEALAPGADDLAGARALAGFLAPVALGDLRGPSAFLGRSRATSNVLGSKPVRAASSSASSSASHCRLSGTSCTGGAEPPLMACSIASSMDSCSGAVGSAAGSLEDRAF